MWLRRRSRIAAAAVVALAALAWSNLSIGPYVLGWKEPFRTYYYETSDLGHRDWECRDSTRCPDFPLVERRFADYRDDSGSGALLRRTFTMKPWAFWDWWSYATHPRWRLPFAAPRYCPDPSGRRCAGFPPAPAGSRGGA